LMISTLPPERIIDIIAADGLGIPAPAQAQETQA
jgi:hypothetical protein